jgi:hypothetical protein
VKRITIAGVALIAVVGVLWSSKDRWIARFSSPNPDGSLAAGRIATVTGDVAGTLEESGPQTLQLSIVRYVGGATLTAGRAPDGTSVSLEDIYRPVNLNVSVSIAPAIQHPFPDRLITSAELHLLSATSPPAAAAWNVTGYMLFRGIKEKDTGVMFAEASRSAFAVFATALQNDPNRILRSTAHELGHALNLFHSDSDADFDCCAGQGGARKGKTLMNQEKCLGPRWEFFFGAAERTHILQHPLGNVKPNGSIGFGSCTAGHQNLC